MKQQQEQETVIEYSSLTPSVKVQVINPDNNEILFEKEVTQQEFNYIHKNIIHKEEDTKEK